MSLSKKETSTTTAKPQNNGILGGIGKIFGGGGEGAKPKNNGILGGIGKIFGGLFGG